jgi:hypothetical protein
MAFSATVIVLAWKRASGGADPPSPAYCECPRETHDHGQVRCNKQLTWLNRGREDVGRWEAHSISGQHIDSTSDCQILCWNCHKLTF